MSVWVFVFLWLGMIDPDLSVLWKLLAFAIRGIPFKIPNGELYRFETTVETVTKTSKRKTKKRGFGFKSK